MQIFRQNDEIYNIVMLPSLDWFTWEHAYKTICVINHMTLNIVSIFNDFIIFFVKSDVL